MSRLEKFFDIEGKGSSLRVEILAGVTTFLTVLYIVPLNGIIMSQAGMPRGAVVTATALITALATVATGLWANTPIAMSVGLGLNSYVAFSLIQGQGIPWETALGMVFISGVFFVILTLTSIRGSIIRAITLELRVAISAGIGLFIAFIGLKELGIIAPHPVTLVTIGKLHAGPVLAGIAGIFILAALVVLGIRGAFILGILGTSVIAYVAGIAPPPSSLFSLPGSIEPIFMKLDIAGALKFSFIAPIVTLMLTDLFDSLGTLSGVGFRAGIFGGDDSVPVQKTLEVDAAATVAGSLLGLTTTTSFIESAAGVEAGGRTGLTSVVTGLLFLLTLFFFRFFRRFPLSRSIRFSLSSASSCLAISGKSTSAISRTGFPLFLSSS